jgi:ectoine hydroxylase-related dioxygenase (phytanoyl-CoA dioxygenase family)
MKSEVRSRKSESNGSGQFEHEGFQVIKSIVGQDECDFLASELTPLFEQQQQSAKNKIGGVRNLLRTNPSVYQFAKNPNILSTLERFSGSPMFPVRAIFFDKNREANWLVPWHQDLAIAVAERIETSGFTGWSVKDGKNHVHPPPEILANMVTMRLHLDDCDASNGALKIIPGSHRHGKLGAADISNWTLKNEVVVCDLSKGDALLMRPLLLHASSPAENPKHRRVLHIEYAAQELPNGLKWLDR